MTLESIGGIPLVEPGDDLAQIVSDALGEAGLGVRSHDILVIAQKIVSKAEGRTVRLSDVSPSPRARKIAAAAGKDPRAVEAVLSESNELVRVAAGVIITENRLGIVMANAGIDMSNVDQASARVLLLPEDPDRSARQIREGIARATGADVGVIINDSAGRAWREGTVGLAIGVSGVPARVDLRGNPDLFGRTLEVAEIALADSLASAAGVLMGEGDEGRPVVLIRGLHLADEEARATDLLRPKERDLFR